jgi:hypothetical protein
MSNDFQPIYSNPRDGELITLCKILESVSSSSTASEVVSGSIATGSGTLTIDTRAFGTLAFSTTAATSGTVAISASIDGVNFFSTTFVGLAAGNIFSSFNVATTHIGQIDTVALTAVKFTASSLVGSIVISTVGSAAVSNIMLDNPIPAGTNTIGAVTSNNALIERTASFTRPANTTAYASGDLVANNATAGSVAPLTFTTVSRNAGDAVRIERARINTSNALLTNASFRLHLFEGTPVPTVGDNGVFNASGVLATSGIDGYVGSFAITLSNSGTTGSTGRGIPDVGNAIIATPTSGTSIFGLLEVTAAYVPVSGATFTVSIEGYRP